MDIFNYLSKQLQQEFNVTTQKADQSADNIITNYANCAQVPVNTVRNTMSLNVKICFDGCYAGALNAHPHDIDSFEKAIISCMCTCAKSMDTRQ